MAKLLIQMLSVQHNKPFLLSVVRFLKNGMLLSFSQLNMFITPSNSNGKLVKFFTISWWPIAITSISKVTNISLIINVGESTGRLLKSKQEKQVGTIVVLTIAGMEDKFPPMVTF